jgi:epoxyqueuosine reductase
MNFVSGFKLNDCQVSFVSITHLDEIREKIESLRREGLLVESLYQDYLSYFKYCKPASLPRAKSIAVVAVPQPQIRVTFHWQGKPIPAVIPPTYIDAIKINRRVRSLLKESLGSNYRFVRAVLPLKYLAVRSGLAQYGLNNITYIPKYGSFHRLTAFFTDYVSEDRWQEPRILEECDACRKCIKTCPTSAITEERFLLKAERCLTYLNEKPAKEVFPDWVKPSWHNAIVGCMICQRVCPYNRKVLNWYESRGELSQAETTYLLSGKYTGRKAARIDRKLRRSGLDLSAFPRNLQALLR